MGVKITVKINSPPQTMNRILDNDVGIFTASTWAKEFKKYVPMDTGILSDSYNIGPYKVIYTQKYAHYQWQGISKKGKPLNYSKEKHYLARSHWEESAERDRKRIVANAITDYIRRRS